MSKINDYRQDIVDQIDDSTRDDEIDKAIEEFSASRKQVVLNRILSRIAKENTANELI